MVVAVSKNHPISAIENRIAEGFSQFGENKAQELAEKACVGLPITWHFIGHIQTNKLKTIVRYATWIHSVDQLKQVFLIEHYASEINKEINLLIQVNLTQESQKGGVVVKDLDALILACATLKHIKLKGLMVMGPSDADPQQTEITFKAAQVLFLQTQKNHPEMTELSMGMSHDYELAYHYGSTCFRLGTILFKQD